MGRGGPSRKGEASVKALWVTYKNVEGDGSHWKVISSGEM